MAIVRIPAVSYQFWSNYFLSISYTKNGQTNCMDQYCQHRFSTAETLTIVPLVISTLQRHLGWFKAESFVQKIKMFRTFQEFEFSNIQIWNLKIQNLEESIKNFDENTKIVFLDQLKWKSDFFEFLRPRYSRSSSLTHHKNPKFKWNQN